MVRPSGTVLIIGSGPNAPDSTRWGRAPFDHIIAINNAWRVRPDWDDLICPEDFPPERRPTGINSGQRVIEAKDYIPAQNAAGGIVFAGGTMAFTAGYYALFELRPRVIAWIGCDMVYPASGATHFYGTGAADPLRDDVTLQDLGAKSARLALMAAARGCHCINLSTGPSRLLFARARPDQLDNELPDLPDTGQNAGILASEQALGYDVPCGRYWTREDQFDPRKLAGLDARWRDALVSARLSGAHAA